MQCARLAAITTILTLLSSAGLAIAEPPAPAASPAKDDSDALRGPSVKSAPKVTSLVKRDMSGKLERLDTRPEQAALDLLSLTPEQRTPADKVLTDRFGAVTKLLQEHQDLFLKIQAARQGGAKPEEIRPNMREMRGFAAPLLDHPLQSQVAAALPEDKRPEFNKLVDEYKRVSATEEPGGMGQGAGGGGGGKGRGRADADKMDGDKSPDPKSAADAPIPPRVEMSLLLREMARALNAVVVERKEHMDAFLKAIEATPEQEAQIRALVRNKPQPKEGDPAATAGPSDPTPQERAANWDKISALLTPEQRRKAMEYRRAN